MNLPYLALGVLCALSMTTASAEPHVQSHPTRGAHSIELDRSAISAAPVQSRADLESHLADNPDSAFHRLSHGGRETFLASLVLTEKGLGSFNYKVLEDELTPTQIHEVLSLFGLGELVSHFKNARVETPHDAQLLRSDQSATSSTSCLVIENHYCSPPATCRYENGAHCITCNCGMDEP